MMKDGYFIGAIDNVTGKWRLLGVGQNPFKYINEAWAAMEAQKDNVQGFVVVRRINGQIIPLNEE